MSAVSLWLSGTVSVSHTGGGGVRAQQSFWNNFIFVNSANSVKTLWENSIGVFPKLNKIFTDFSEFTESVLSVSLLQNGRVSVSYTGGRRFKHRSNPFLKQYNFCHWIQQIQWKYLGKAGMCPSEPNFTFVPKFRITLWHHGVGLHFMGSLNWVFHDTYFCQIIWQI